MTQDSTTDAGFRVFVGNLSYHVNSAKLKEFFSQVGNVIDAIHIRRNGRFAGYGFVVFDTEEAADKAVTLKDAELEDRKINVERATPRDPDAPKRESSAPRRGGRRFGAAGRGRPPRRERPQGEPSTTVLFVGNLPFNVVDQDLVNIFADYKIEKAQVARRFDGGSRGFGFVTFSSEDEQKKALDAMSEVWCDERKLVIRPAVSENPDRNTEVQHEVVIKN